MIPDGTSSDFASERFEAKSEETAGMVLLDLGFRFGTVRGGVWTPESHGDSLSLPFLLPLSLRETGNVPVNYATITG